MAWGSYYTASSFFANGATTGTWKDATGGAMTLPAIPTGANGAVNLMFITAVGNTSAVVTAVTTTSWGVSSAGALSGVISAIVGHSIIA